MICVIHAPMYLVTGQAVLARECCNVIVFDAAETGFSGGPQRAARAKAEAIHPAGAKPFGDRVRLPNRSVCEVGNTSSTESQPYSVLRMISQDNAAVVAVSQCSPRKFLDHSPLE